MQDEDIFDLLNTESISEGFDSGNLAGSYMIRPPDSPKAYAAEESRDQPSPAKYSINAPHRIVDNLIDLFFQKVSGFIPLLHRPNFYQKYRERDADCCKYRQLTLEDALILNGMLALSARFSTSSYFNNAPPKERAVSFAREAKALYQESVRLQDPVPPSLALLQGYILLAFYHQICETSSLSWTLTGICCRLAYELGYDALDESISGGQWSSAIDWAQQEERRRAWWLTWELDCFASSVLCRPNMIDQGRFNVLLPVSDKHWFSNSPLASAKLNSSSLGVWKSLQDCPNQDERAWFLVASSLMVVIHDKVHRGNPSPEDIIEYEQVLNCFSLLLPVNFQLTTGPLNFEEDNFAGSNWILSTTLMLHTVRQLVKSHSASKPISFTAASRSNSENEKFVARVLREWNPDFIALACPLVAATLVGPGVANVLGAGNPTTRSNQHASSSYYEIVKLVLKRIGSYWEIGSSVLKLIQLLEKPQAFEDMEQAEKEELNRLQMLLPKGPLTSDGVIA
ncbi:fungal-specific transcription factor domain-containing protein [Xylogone sp. PMI_703]|nr:fungal-specific transcription factor domain-containing protein [Xylogone sp. PMI_703]